MLQEKVTGHRIVLALVPLIALLGCVASPNAGALKSEGTNLYGDWIGIVDNGDKPGIGILLLISKHEKAFELYLLHPEHLDDFAKGRKIPVTNLTWKGEQARFDLDFGGGYKGSYDFMFKKTEDAPTLSAVLQELKEDRGPVQIVLRRNTAKLGR